jgi:uncharacterized membrane protein YeaQ/YmgE (transglycosylase-associated protein family)
MYEFVWWLLVGITAGAVARFVLPGKQALSWYGTLSLGLLGSLLGGAVSAVVYGFDPLEPGFHPAGFVMASVGALLLLASYVTYTRRTAAPNRLVL